MILHIIFILYFSACSNRVFIPCSDRGSFIVSLKMKNEWENTEITIGIENRMKHRLELVFSHILSKYTYEDYLLCGPLKL
jgi:hypothetical protein